MDFGYYYSKINNRGAVIVGPFLVNLKRFRYILMALYCVLSGFSFLQSKECVYLELFSNC